MHCEMLLISRFVAEKNYNLTNNFCDDILLTIYWGACIQAERNLLMIRPAEPVQVMLT